MSDDLDNFLSSLVAEAAAFSSKRGRPAKVPPKGPQRTEAGWTTGRPSPRPPIDRLKLLHEQRIQDFDSMHRGILPGGWEIEGLFLQIIDYTCETCGSFTSALSPPTVFLVTRLVRHHETKYMTPLKRGELSYYTDAAGFPLTTEHTSTFVPVCQHCLGEPPR